MEVAGSMLVTRVCITRVVFLNGELNIITDCYKYMLPFLLVSFYRCHLTVQTVIFESRKRVSGSSLDVPGVSPLTAASCRKREQFLQSLMRVRTQVILLSVKLRRLVSLSTRSFPPARGNVLAGI